MSDRDRLETVIRFIVDRLIAIRYNETNPATWGHIIRELRKCGFEVRP